MVYIKKLAAGIMSGTSLDGIDIAIANIEGYDRNTKINFIKGITVPWKTNTYKEIKDVLSLKTSNIELVSKLNYKISYEYYEGLKTLCKSLDIKPEDLDFISIHGQTVWHDPTNKDMPSTLQLGSGSVLSALAKTTVISNFRLKDIVLKGEGAPLVPVFDQLVFDSKDKTIALHNLGGISNLTLLKDNEILLAYDTGPSNMMIDYFMKKFYNKPYDDKGNKAKSGNIIKPLYDEVMNLKFFKQLPPKSTGRELFGDQYSKYLYEKYSGYNYEDYVRTATEITINSIVDSYKYLIKKYNQIDEIIFSGGGTHNDFLINQIKKQLPNVKISKSSKYNIDIDFKEAIAFIVLGNQTFEKRKTNLSKATGSEGSIILGDISYY